MAEPAKIAALDGPYLGKDPVVVDAEGNEFRSEHETIALCRSGGATIAKRTRSPRALYAFPNTPPLAPGFEGAAKEVSPSSEREEITCPG